MLDVQPLLPIIGVAVSGLVGYGVMKGGVNAIEKRVAHLEDRDDDIQQWREEVISKLSRIETLLEKNP